MKNAKVYSKNQNLNLPNVRKKIFRYVYQYVKTELYFETISSNKDLDYIRNNDYIICPEFNGTRVLIIFVRFGNQYYAVNFFKRKNGNIHPIDITVSKEFYNGTIMEGIFFRMDEKRYLIVDEVYLLAGHNQLLKSKDDRLTELSTFIVKNTIINPKYNMYVSQFFHIDKEGLSSLYEKIKSDPKIQRIIFYPKIYGKKIYCYTIIDDDLVDQIIKTALFHMQSTPNPDVYYLFSPNSKIKSGIAYIPDIETSKKCKMWFKIKKSKELLVRCKMDMDKKKWIPLELVSEK
ncbi:MAG: hypothetical protein QXW79_00510 [Thermoplasmata archaeon]